MTDRVDVRKTYKLFINGAFVRSESGRSYEATNNSGVFVANIADGSRKDARDAVVAARAAQPGWQKATAYNRGQVVYRIAEVLESRRSQLVDELHVAEGIAPKKANKIIDQTIDRLVWYAGWSDKLSSIVGGNNAVAGPFFNFSVPDSTGVIAVVAPQDDSLLGLVSVIAPAIITGNSVVVIAAFKNPLPAITLSEILATSDVPAGVVNILTGDFSQIAPWLAEHMDVDGLDLAGAYESDLATALERASTVNVKRVVRYAKTDWTQDPGLTRLRAWIETKTVWHPIGN